MEMRKTIWGIQVLYDNRFKKKQQHQEGEEKK
jgi:hypothetical protein